MDPFTLEAPSKSAIEGFRLETVEERRSRVSRLIYGACNGIVRHGPFSGMWIPSAGGWSDSDLGSKLLGLYEFPVLSRLFGIEHEVIFQDSFKNIVVLGAADGYYSIGAIISGLAENAFAFEKDPLSLDAIRESATRNQVGNRLHVFGAAGPDFMNALGEIDWSRTLVFCDIEGAEETVLGHEFFRVAHGASLLVELHPWAYKKDSGQAIHNIIASLNSTSQDWGEFYSGGLPKELPPELYGMPDDNRLLALSEGRPSRMSYLWGRVHG